MTQTVVSGRQEPQYALADCGIANLGTGNEAVIGLPPNALLLEVSNDVVTAFNAGTTSTCTVSDGTTSFINADSIAATGAATGTGVPVFYPAGGTLTVSLAQTGTAATAGRVLVYVKYLQVGRAQKTYG